MRIIDVSIDNDDIYVLTENFQPHYMGSMKKYGIFNKYYIDYVIGMTLEQCLDYLSK